MKSRSILPANEDKIVAILSPYLASFRDPGAGLGLVIDADRTLAPEDSGRLVGAIFGLNERIRHVFETLGYTDRAFEKVSEFWGQVEPVAYLQSAERVGEGIRLRPAWARVLRASIERAPAIVVSAGIPQIWRAVLNREGFSGVPVIGGCHPALDEFLVCPGTKAQIVNLIQRTGRRVLAAGDSAIDLQMLQKADFPIFVPDDRGSPGLRALLGKVPRVRHFLVDNQSFDDLATCRVEELLELVIKGSNRP